MDPFKTVTGGVSVLMRDDIDTDQIIPARYMKKIERSGFGEHLFADINTAALGYRCTEHVPTQNATHVVLTK